VEVPTSRYRARQETAAGQPVEPDDHDRGGCGVNPRRLVTGHDASGRAVVVRDDLVEPVTPALAVGYEWHLLFGTDGPAEFPDDGSVPGTGSFFPPVGGSRFTLFTIPPEGGPSVPDDLDIGAALEEFEQELPGMAAHMEPDAPGMHTSATVDYGVVLSGRATLELDDGATYVLAAGDTYVQNGTRHRWSNSGKIPAVIAVVLIGAHHRGMPDPSA
jgi:quercetin dioxygenase-like cupin family protein